MTRRHFQSNVDIGNAEQSGISRSGGWQSYYSVSNSAGSQNGVAAGIAEQENLRTAERCSDTSPVVKKIPAV
jgi:hypothetical protein